MKNIIVIIITVFALSFSSIVSASEKDFNFTENVIKTDVTKEAIQDYLNQYDAKIKRLYNVHIVDKNSANTNFGRVDFYVITAEFTAEIYHFHVVLHVYTGSKKTQNFYACESVVASSTNQSQMREYYDNLSKFKGYVKNKTALAVAGTKLALM